MNCRHIRTDRIITGVREALRAIGGPEPQALLLFESQHPKHPSSRTSYLAACPKRELIIDDSSIRIVHQSPNGVQTEKYPDLWSALEVMRGAGEWIFGYIGYDVKNHTEPTLFSGNPALIDAPDLYMFTPGLLLEIGTEGVEVLCDDLGVMGDIGVMDGLRVMDELGVMDDLGTMDDLKVMDKHSSEVETNPLFRVSNLRPLINPKQFQEAIAAIQGDIREGEYYELNYSYPMQADFEGDAYELYRAMRRRNPVPFGAYLERGDLAVVCASPERYLQCEGGRLLSEPIKGTAARKSNRTEDEREKSTLLNEKNRAENVMIVDLVRHDFSRVCIAGSVRVEDLFEIQSFGTVHQLISRVTGELAAGNTVQDAIRVSFPMGSMTGAPKLRVMQRIEELEIYKRGIYSGSFGYFSPDGKVDLNVVIRTAMIQNGTLVYPVGGAIVSDSKADEEWAETKTKAVLLTDLVTSSNKH